MTIGIDLSSLQGAHRMRGIGYTLLNLINFMSDEDKAKHRYVFYCYPDSEDLPNPLDLLDLDGISYEVRYLSSKKRVTGRIRGKLGMLTGLINQVLELRDLYIGDARINNLRGVDYFLQTDQSQSLPRRHIGTRYGLILYDIIPFVLEWDYLWSYRVSRIRGDSRKAALRKHVHRWLYAHKLKINTRRAHQLLSISDHTKNDFVQHLGISRTKIKVTPLGVSEPENIPHLSSLVAYRSTSWGYLPFNTQFDDKVPYILFVGGADSRRRLDDLVGAFNVLRARGVELKLVLSGDSMQGPKNIATDNIRKSLLNSSYLDDIVFVGFADDATRDWLYANCLCFVFPSQYEGFGLPVLEAMIHGSPVICYDNAATREVALDVPIYVSDIKSIADEVDKLLHLKQPALEIIKSRNMAQARKYNWQKTSKQIFSTISSKQN